MAGKKNTKSKTTASARKVSAQGVAKESKTSAASKKVAKGKATAKTKPQTTGKTNDRAPFGLSNSKAAAKTATRTEPKKPEKKAARTIDSKIDSKATVGARTQPGASKGTQTKSETERKAKSEAKTNAGLAPKSSAKPRSRSDEKSPSKAKASPKKSGATANTSRPSEAKAKAKAKASGEAPVGERKDPKLPKKPKSAKKPDADLRQSEGAPTQDPPSAGSIAPDFSLPTDEGTDLRLSDLRGRRVVLYFYPKDMTPGCTQQACAFRDAHDEFVRRDTVILGVSRDTSLKHQRFREKERLPFRLLSDVDAAVIRAYGSWGPKKFMGRSFDGILRTTVIIGEDGRVEKVYSKVSPKEHAQQILTDLDARR